MIKLSDILIKNGFIITMDQNRRIIRDGAIYVNEGEIVSVGKTEEVASSSAEFVIDAKNKVILPGFVNVHTHLPSIFVRGVYGVMAQGLTSVLFPLKTYFTPEDMYLFGLASCGEALYGGSTTIVETYNYLDHFARAVEEIGLRAVLGEQIVEADLMKIKDGVYEYNPEQAEKGLKRARALIEKWQGGVNDKITTIVAPLAPDMTGPDTYRECDALSKEYGLDISTHLSQSWGEVKQVKKMYGKTPPMHLAELGIMDHRLSGAHCTYVTDEERVLMSRTGAKILHCPRPYAAGGRTNPLVQYLDMGIPVGLGTDNVYHSMNETLRVGLFASRIRSQFVGGSNRMLAVERPSHLEMLELATIKGAEVMGLDDKVGSLEPGKRADIIAYDMMSPHLTPTMEPLSSILLYGTSPDIDTVIVDGEIRKENHRIKGSDMNKILTDAQRRVDELWTTFFEDNPESRRLWEIYLPY